MPTITVTQILEGDPVVVEPPDEGAIIGNDLIIPFIIGDGE